MRRQLLCVAVVTVAAAAISACATGDGRQLAPPELALPTTTVPEAALPAEPTVTADSSVPAPFTLIASWRSGEQIPARHTCDGEDLAPALTWTNVPDGTVELAVTVVDLDAAGFVHWILYGIAPEITSLTENQQPPPGDEWLSSAGSIGWFGPCPPASDGDHVYQFTIHALDRELQLADGTAATEVISTLNQIAIDQGSVTGTYARVG
jgi:Raf kinase inhibitor-like YbhB/YbcL family protein